MSEGFEVVIKYKDQKYIQLNSANLTHSQEIAILKKDLAHLRVHSPAQKNVRRVGGAFLLHWPTAGTSPNVEMSDSLHTRWFKLCANDSEALKLREFLSIESITLFQDGLLLRSTDSAEPNEGLHPAHDTLAARLNVPEQPPQSQPATQPALAPVPTTAAPHAKPQPHPQPPRVPPTAPRSDRLQHLQQLKRRMSNPDGPSPTRQKLDTRDSPPHQSPLTMSPRVDIPPQFDHISSPTILPKTISQSPTQTQAPPTTPTITMREPGEVTPLPGTPANGYTTSTVPVQPLLAPFTAPEPAPSSFTPFSAPFPDTSTAYSAPSPATATPFSATSPVSGSVISPSPIVSRAPPTGPLITPALPTGPRLSPAPAPVPPTGPRLSPHPYPRPRTTSPRPHPHPPKTASPNGGNGTGTDDPSRKSLRDVQRLTRELWDTRRQLTAVQAREQVILDELETLGVRPGGSGSISSGGGASNSHDELLRLDAELCAERARRLRAERVLSDVERECRAPFVVPALFQAFMVISELSS